MKSALRLDLGESCRATVAATTAAVRDRRGRDS